jgi:hypothetical protein
VTAFRHNSTKLKCNIGNSSVSLTIMVSKYDPSGTKLAGFMKEPI